MTALPKITLTQADYLRIERAAETKSEFYRGEMFAMSGASRQHNRLSINISSSLHGQLRKSPCEAFANDMRVKVSETGLYTYPDVAVACGTPQFEDKQLDTLLNPTVIIEVLSKSTESYDRGAKFAQYRQLPSLQTYLLVSQDRLLVERFTRDGNEWRYQAYEHADEVVNITAIDCTLRLADCYERVEFELADNAATPSE